VILLRSFHLIAFLFLALVFSGLWLPGIYGTVLLPIVQKQQQQQ